MFLLYYIYGTCHFLKNMEIWWAISSHKYCFFFFEGLGDEKCILILVPCTLTKFGAEYCFGWPEFNVKKMLA